MDKNLKDIEGRECIDTLVNSFYQKVRSDEVLGHIFDGIAKVDWPSHLPKIASFWETVLFRTGGYKGNPLAAHAKWLTETELNRSMFDQWLSLFNETVDAHFEGPNAKHIKSCADDMANVIHDKINGVKRPKFDPVQLTDEQKARYAKYKENK